MSSLEFSPVPPFNRRSLWTCCLIVVAAALALYGPTIGYDFAYDDSSEVVDNLLIRSLANVPEILTTTAWTGSGEPDNPLYRPVTTLTYAVDHAIWGPRPGGFHATNVLLNALVGVLVLLLSIELGTGLVTALVAALLFVVLPAHVEAVANVAGRKELLSAAFAITTVLAHARAMRRGGWALLVAPALMALAFFSKESGVSTVGLCIAHDLVFAPDGWREHPRRVLALYATYMLEVAGFLLARRAVIGSVADFSVTAYQNNPIVAAPLPTRAMTAIAVIGFGLTLLVAPITLSPDYSFAAILPIETPLDPKFLLSVSAISVFGLLAWRFRCRFPLGLFSFLWYGAAILPASNLLVPIGTIFGERLLYLPSVAVALVCSAGLGELVTSTNVRTRRVSRLAVGLVLAALAIRTSAYLPVWTDDEHLFSAAVRAQPRSIHARQLHASHVARSGRLEDAVRDHEIAAAVASMPGVAVATRTSVLVDLGYAYQVAGHPTAAEQAYHSVLRVRPNHLEAKWRLGTLRWEQGRADDAVALLGEVVRSDPRHAGALSDLGVTRFVAGDLQGARALWERSTQAAPRKALAWFRLAKANEALGDRAAARRHYARFLELDDPDLKAERAEAQERLRRL